MPSTSVSMNSAAPRIERSTCVSAAKLTTASQPSPAFATASASQMSPSTSRTSQPSRFAGLPEYVSLSSTTTSSPAASRRLTKCEPMKPAPPVTRIRIARKASGRVRSEPRPVSDTELRQGESVPRLEQFIPRPDSGQARAQALAPVRQPRRALAFRCGAPSTRGAAPGGRAPRSRSGGRGTSIPASSKIASRELGPACTRPSAATCQTPRSPRSTSPRVAAARWPT